MKKETEKQPIDDLFARKLSNLSLSPSADGFDRLQKRLSQDKPDRRIGLWYNSSEQRYMAAAACLVIVGLFGWLYWQLNAQSAPEESQVATKHVLSKHPKLPIQSDQAGSVVASGQKEDQQLALVDETTVSKKSLPQAQLDNTHKPVLPHQSARNEPNITQADPIKANVGLQDTRLQHTPQIEHSAPEQLATNPVFVPVKPNPSAERVLIVTIEEPASLVAARQTAQKFVDEKPALIKEEKETKGGVWNQVKRFKEGELFARHSDETTDERGLLDRAYTSLKHSIDKNKPAKQ